MAQYGKAIEILKSYDGKNPLILEMKRDVLVRGNSSRLNDFTAEYITENHKSDPIVVNRTMNIADWFGKKLAEKYEIEFTPSKILIIACFGETKTAYHFMVKYRQNMEPIELFMPRKALMGDFRTADYRTVSVDFDRYDRLSMARDPERRLMDHQKDAVKFLLSRKKCILADDMGLGKTTSLSVAAIEGNFDSVLVICPSSLKSGWRNELLWYVPDKDITIISNYASMTKAELEEYLGYRVGGSGLSVKELREEAAEKGKWRDNRFVIVNFDILDEFDNIPNSRSRAAVEEALAASPMMRYIKDRKALIIIDEAHRLSNSKSTRYKVVRHLIRAGKPDSVYLSTGTPITNNPQNFFCVLNLIENEITGDWQYYMDRYCGAVRIPAKGEKEKWSEKFYENLRKGGRNVSVWRDLTPKEKDRLKEFISINARKITIPKDATNLDELRLRVSHLYLRRTKEDIMDELPEKRVEDVMYDFTPAQKREYDRLWDEYEAAQLELDPGKEINRELLEGAVYRKYCSDQMVPNTIKMAEDFISHGHKVIIATCYDDELYALRDYFGDRCVVYNGKMNPKQKDAAELDFKTNPDKKVFIGQIIAAGVGLTLTVADIIIFNNMSFVPGDNRQMEDRIYRIGQTKAVTIYYQMFRKTQYERIWNTVLKKELVINRVIRKENEK